MQFSHLDPDRRPTLVEVLRKEPRQQRSRDKVDHVLACAEQLVVRRGVADLTMNEIAEAAGVKAATLYDFFEDVEAVLLAIILADADAFDERALTMLLALEHPTLREVVDTAVEAFTQSHSARPAFVAISLRHTEHQAIAHFGAVHNRDIARALLDFAAGHDLVTGELTYERVLFCVDVMDTIFQIAYETDVRGDRDMIERGATMLYAFLAQFEKRPTTDSPVQAAAS